MIILFTLMLCNLVSVAICFVYATFFLINTKKEKDNTKNIVMLLVFGILSYLCVLIMCLYSVAHTTLI